MDYKGKIFELLFPFTELTDKKSRSALAITEPDEFGEIEFLLVTTKQAKVFDNVIELTDDFFEGEKPSFPSVLHLDKRYRFPGTSIVKKIACVTNTFLERIMHEQVIYASKNIMRLSTKIMTNPSPLVIVSPMQEGSLTKKR